MKPSRTAHRTLFERVAAYAERTPLSIAISAKDSEVTYEQLRDTTLRIAKNLHAIGVQKGDLIGLCMARRSRLMTTLLGVQCAGGAYAVISDAPDINIVELQQRLSAAQPAYIIFDSYFEDKAVTCSFPTIDCNELLVELSGESVLPAVQSQDTAYVIFTSGSTGVPKGVAVTHGNLSCYIDSLCDRLSLDEPMRYAHVSTFSADLGHTSYLAALATGGAIHIVDDLTRRDPSLLFHYLAHSKIDVLKMTPSHWRAVLGYAKGKSRQDPLLKLLILGGEALPHALAKDTLECGLAQRLVNHYGPTETTVGVALNEVNLAEVRFDLQTIPIGSALAHAHLLIRGDDGSFRQKATTGELFIGGPSVVPGYVRNEQATQESFVTGVFGDERFYRSGDRVQADENGTLHFLGRLDRQVKVRGYRVELEHVEAVLRAVPGVLAAAAFVSTTTGISRLLAAVSLDTSRLTSARLRSELIERLPGYMLPHVVELPSLPLNANGKLDLGAIQKLTFEAIRAQGASSITLTNEFQSDPILATVAAVWMDCLQHDCLGLDDDFFEAGGDSLAAIAVIAELQSKGLEVSANTFQRNSTIRTLATAIATPKPPETSYCATVDSTRSAKIPPPPELSPAQKWFFRQQFAAPHHWNQVILLECRSSLDYDILLRVTRAILDRHPVLHTAYRREADTWAPVPQAADADACLSQSICDEAAPGSIERELLQQSAKLHEGIDFESGRVFHLRWVAFPQDRHFLLLVAHHLAVDAVSWRHIITDLVELYSAYVHGRAAPNVRGGTDIWEWAAHLNRHQVILAADLFFWQNLQSSPPSEHVCGEALSEESQALTAWAALSTDQTAALLRPISSKLQAHPSIIVLAAFADALAKHTRDASVVVEVESHGRVSFDEHCDPSAAVGWFTSAFPVVIDASAATPEAQVHSVSRIMSLVPHLGTAYRGSSASPPLTRRWSPKVCFNFLGTFRIPLSSAIDITFSRHAVSPARGGQNARPYDLILSVRIVEERLVADLSFSSTQYPEPKALAILANTLRFVSSLVDGIPNTVAPSVYLESGSRSGHLTYVPKELCFDVEKQIDRPYRKVLLTGATGFIGIHLLNLLLKHSRTHVICVIRSKEDRGGYDRLREAYREYFGEELSSLGGDRCTVIDGDVAQADFGLASGAFRGLARDVEAIYHLAADTRLFGSWEAFEQQNVAPVKTAIALARQERPKDLHFMSTLSISGTNRSYSGVFAEDSFDIGQEFRNGYERSKWMAERLVREFVEDGGRAYIYRTGNVTGCSATGAFQRNATDNRLVQFLVAVAAVRQVPRVIKETVPLSPIDIVAKSLFLLSTRSFPPGSTFHIESPFETSLTTLLQSMSNRGISLVESDASDFAEVFSRERNLRNPEVSLGYFWVNREESNVKIESNQTLQRLAGLGIRFSPLSPAWCDLFVQNLIDRRVFSATKIKPPAPLIATDPSQSHSPPSPAQTTTP